MEKLRLINIIGIDGAGKTTLAKSLASDLKNFDKKFLYRYCQYFAILLYPVKVFAKLSVMRKTDEFVDYNHYNKTKRATSHRFPLLSNFYAFIWIIDYLIQISLKVTISIIIGQKLIVDRYIFDTAVNLSLTTGNDIGYGKKILKLLSIFTPKPDLILFIDLSEEIAFDRKDDIQSVEYLRERRGRYLELAEDYNFKTLDGTKCREVLLQDAKNILRKKD